MIWGGDDGQHDDDVETEGMDWVMEGRRDLFNKTDVGNFKDFSI